MKKLRLLRKVADVEPQEHSLSRRSSFGSRWLLGLDLCLSNSNHVQKHLQRETKKIENEKQQQRASDDITTEVYVNRFTIPKKKCIFHAKHITNEWLLKFTDSRPSSRFVTSKHDCKWRMHYQCTVESRTLHKGTTRYNWHSGTWKEPNLCHFYEVK